MALGHLSAGQPHPHRSVQPAGTFHQPWEEGLTQEETLAARRYRSEPQFASLVPPMQHHAPPEGRPLVPVPFEHPEELFA